MKVKAIFPPYQAVFLGICHPLLYNFTLILIIALIKWEFWHRNVFLLNVKMREVPDVWWCPLVHNLIMTSPYLEHLHAVLWHAAVVCRILRDRLDAMQSQGDVNPCLSFTQLAAGLRRSEAAKLFYQICGKFFIPVPPRTNIENKSHKIKRILQEVSKFGGFN